MLRQDVAPQVMELPQQAVADPLRLGIRATLSAYLSLTKPRIVVLLLVTTVPAMMLAEGGMPSIWLVLLTLIGGTLAAGGANAINCYLDRDIDGVMARTKERPLPAGVIEPERALIFGASLGIGAFLVPAASTGQRWCSSPSSSSGRHPTFGRWRFVTEPTMRGLAYRCCRSCAANARRYGRSCCTACCWLVQRCCWRRWPTLGRSTSARRCS